MIGHKAVHNNREYSYWISTSREDSRSAILMIHGFGGTYSGLENLSTMLSKEATIVGLDLPGYGLSEQLQGRHTLRKYAAFLDQFCKTTEHHRLIVVGHSFGADIALVFAARYPKRIDKLILINPVLISNRRFARLAKHYYQFISHTPYKIRHWLLHNHLLTWVSAYSLFKNASSKTRSKILRDDYISDHLMSDRPVIESYYSLLSTPFIKVASKIKAPTLILSGSVDVLSPPKDMEQLHAAVIGSELVIVKGEGHFMPIESAPVVAKEIRKFIA
jgi:pimeloyl-ACP methyl ester carboxylesterase